MVNIQQDYNSLFVFDFERNILIELLLYIIIPDHFVSKQY